MPIYEYKCGACGKVTEVLIRSARQNVEPLCSHCGSRDLKKIFSTPAAVISGYGSTPGTTCCGRDERCDAPPCSEGGTCRRD